MQKDIRQINSNNDSEKKFKLSVKLKETVNKRNESADDRRIIVEDSKKT